MNPPAFPSSANLYYSGLAAAPRRGPEASQKSPEWGRIMLFGRSGLPGKRPQPMRRVSMINLTANAAAKVKGILEQEKENIPQGGLRIYVQGGGCSGFSYGMVLDEAAEGDQIFEKEGVKVIVDPMSLRYLEGAEVDYKEDLMGGGFAIKNPNATSTCGCGHSFNTGGESAGHGHGGHQH